MYEQVSFKYPTQHDHFFQRVQLNQCILLFHFYSSQKKLYSTFDRKTLFWSQLAKFYGI